MAPCGIARTYVRTHTRTYVRFPFLFFTVFQFWFLRRRRKARPSSNDIGHPTAAGECEEGEGAQVDTYAGHGGQRSRSPNSSRRAAGAAAAQSTASASAQASASASASASAPAGAPAATGPPVGQTRKAQTHVVLFRTRLGKWRPARGQGQGEALGGGRTAGQKARVNGEGGGGPTRATAAN